MGRKLKPLSNKGDYIVGVYLHSGHELMPKMKATDFIPRIEVIVNGSDEIPKNKTTT
jgi:hypothetical protein